MRSYSSRQHPNAEVARGARQPRALFSAPSRKTPAAGNGAEAGSPPQTQPWAPAHSSLHVPLQPGRANENSPAFQRWVGAAWRNAGPARDDRKLRRRNGVLSSMTGLETLASGHPSVETLGHSRSPCRAETGVGKTRFAPGDNRRCRWLFSCLCCCTLLG